MVSKSVLFTIIGLNRSQVVVMRIALRTSGGRGEYEIAGSHSGTTVSDLYDYQFVIQLLPGVNIETHNRVRHLQGQDKPRIRLDQNGDHHRHIYLILADILLLPKPKRELNATPPGKLQLVDNNFSVTSINFDILRKDSVTKLAVIRPTKIILSNSDNNDCRLEIIERMRIVMEAWDCSNGLSDGQLNNLLNRHKLAFESGVDDAIHTATKEIRKKLTDIGKNEGDPLRQIIQMQGIEDENSYWMGLHAANADEDFVDDDPTDLGDATRRSIRQWRMTLARGVAALRFSREIKRAYRNRCLFTGNHFPKLDMIESAGVDAAHILPWASHQLNSINNGVCLNKTCHWAFDNGILRLNYSPQDKTYNLVIPEVFLAAERKRHIDLAPFHRLIGPIPKERLPEDEVDWPSPCYLDQYNNAMEIR